MKIDNYDFTGLATKNNLKCKDGRTIMNGAFDDCDGAIVPMVWHHQWNSVDNVLGHALLRKVNDGIRAFCFFNDTEAGQKAKKVVQHKDVSSLSIYADELVQQGSAVMHGIIREVSLVLAGANPGARIDNVIQHGDELYYLDDNAGVITTGEGVTFEGSLEHSGMDDEDDSKGSKDSSKSEKDKGSEDGEKNYKEIYDSMSADQKEVVNYIAGSILQEQAEKENNDKDDDDEGGNNKMKHNLFDNDSQQNNAVLIHTADQASILETAKLTSVGSFQDALAMYAENNHIEHDALAGGFVQTGEGNVTYLFPEYKEVRPGAPELITSDQGWISVVLDKVHKSPVSRIRTSTVDIRNIEALRAKGYKKGKQKKLSGNFKLLRRTTDPQTVYVKNALHKDDISDITDFDYVQYLYNIDRMMLNEELATAIMIGDSRDDGDEDKIYPDKIRPIWTDDDIYTIHKDIDLDAAKQELQGTNTNLYFGPNYIFAEAMVETVLHAREDYKGSGTPTMYITPFDLNKMLLARDRNGRRIYPGGISEVAAVFNVDRIVTAEQFANRTRTVDGKTKRLVCLIANLADYALGATKGGEITHFTQFDIDFNQQKSLIEGRFSGALTRVYSAIAIEEDVTASTDVSDEDDQEVG